MIWFLYHIYTPVGWVIRLFMVGVILRRLFAPGAAVAWLGIIFLHPYIGVVLYLLLGENRLGHRRADRHRELIAQFRPALYAEEKEQKSKSPDLEPPYEAMVVQAEKISSMPVLSGNSVDFLTSVEAMVDRLVADLDAARSQAHLLYYMFAPDATGERVVAALERAAKRGVRCRVLVDAVAGRAFFRRHGLATRLTNAGVKVAAALPVALIRRRLPRMDLRNHRKLALIDDAVAYAGSHNLINADYGGRRGAPWVDVTGRFTGPVVAELATVFAEDWAFETDERLDVPKPPPDAYAADPSVARGVPMQVVPTGPSAPDETYRRVLLAAIQSARRRLVITTPYFVPDEPTVLSLLMAVDRGVDVSIAVPKVPDLYFTAAAGRAHFSSLLHAGASIYLYRPGLLHAKTTTVDDAFAVFGSANLDVRSFHLNFELTTLLYGREVTDRLRTIQLGYIEDSDKLDAKQWDARPAVKRYAESAVSLLSPLL